MSIVPKELVDQAPNCLISQFFCEESTCTNFFTKCTTVVIGGDDYNWALRLQCSVCDKIWWLCKECNICKKMLIYNQLNRHHYGFHKNQSLSQPKRSRRELQPEYVNMYQTETDLLTCDDVGYDTIEYCPIIGNDNDYSNDATIEDTKKPAIDGRELWIANDVSDEIRTIMTDIIKGNHGIHFINENTAEFYAYDIISSGVKYLITKMWSNEGGDPSAVFQRIDGDEVKCQVAIGQFCESLSRIQQEEFGKLIEMMKKSYFQKEQSVVCNLPTSLSDVRRLYIDGKESFTKNLPIPNIYELDNHSYISIIDCVADFLYANTHPLTNLEDFRIILMRLNYTPSMSIFGTKRVDDIVEEASDRMIENEIMDDNGKNIVVLFFKLWSDDFDPNTSVKSNRQSVWVKTLSIFARLQDGSKVTYTYPIATAPKGCNHDEVDLRISLDLEKLRKGKLLTFFCRSSLKPVFVHADIFCVLADQPERRTILNIAAGNSTNHKRFGYLLDYQNLIDVIRPCNRCIESIDYEVNKYINVEWKQMDFETNHYLRTQCPDCSNWMLFEDHALLTYEPDKNYPVSKLDSTGKLILRRVTRKNLQRCIDEVDLALEEKKWNVVTAKSYLKSEGFHQKAIDSIVDFTLNRIAYKKQSRANEPDNRSHIAIREDYEKNPLIYQKWKLPYSWKLGEDTQLYVDVPMHLLFLGVGKSVFTRITRWLKLRMKSTEFKEMTVGKLDVLKTYNIEWCKIILYPHGSSEKFGGWVAENFLGFIRIASWFYSMLTHLKEKNDLRLLQTPATAWRVKENKMWLEIRGLSTEGSAREIKARVRELMEMDTPPPILTIENEDTNDVLTLISLLTEMIGAILSRTTKYDNIDYVELIIRKFLNHYDKLDKEVLQEEKQPSWMTQYNFLSLLNIPDIMRNYGCCRNIWEGGIEGEGFLRKYKPELKNGLKHKWQIWTIKIYCKATYSRKRILITTNHGKKHYRWSVEYINNIQHFLLHLMMGKRCLECLIIYKKKFSFASV